MAQYNVGLDVTITYSIEYLIEAQTEQDARNIAINRVFKKDNILINGENKTIESLHTNFIKLV